MTTRTDLRFNLHFVPGTDRALWSLMEFRISPNGVPTAVLQLHGAVDFGDADPHGLDAVAALLVRAASRVA